MDLNSIRASLASRSAAAPPPVVDAAADRAPAGKASRLAAPRLSAPRPSLVTKLVTRFRAPVEWVRKHHRHPCCIVGVLMVLDRNVPLDGLVTEISEGGALFRPASDYIFDRHGAAIALRFADREWRGQIVNVRKRGYGIRLDSEVGQEEIDDILARFGLDMVASEH